MRHSISADKVLLTRTAIRTWQLSVKRFHLRFCAHAAVQRSWLAFSATRYHHFRKTGTLEALMIICHSHADPLAEWRETLKPCRDTCMDQGEAQVRNGVQIEYGAHVLSCNTLVVVLDAISRQNCKVVDTPDPARLFPMRRRATDRVVDSRWSFIVSGGLSFQVHAEDWAAHPGGSKGGLGGKEEQR